MFKPTKSFQDFFWEKISLKKSFLRKLRGGTGLNVIQLFVGMFTFTCTTLGHGCRVRLFLLVAINCCVRGAHSSSSLAVETCNLWNGKNVRVQESSKQISINLPTKRNVHHRCGTGPADRAESKKKNTPHLPRSL